MKMCISDSLLLLAKATQEYSEDTQNSPMQESPAEEILTGLSENVTIADQTTADGLLIAFGQRVYANCGTGIPYLRGTVIGFENIASTRFHNGIYAVILWNKDDGIMTITLYYIILNNGITRLLQFEA